MKSIKINRADTGLFSEQHIKMVYDQSFYKDFIYQPFAINAFEEQIAMKSDSFTWEQREALKNALKGQYTTVETSASTAANIESLSDSKTFTITTGHQLSLFTGPLYFVVKILHVVKMCEELKVKFPDKHFVPVYWMATEDHDFEEIQSSHLFNQTITWDSLQRGPVGRFDLEGFEEVKNQLKELFSNHPNSEVMNAIEKFDGKNFTEATRNLVNTLFGEKGLVIVDGDDADLKKLFAPTVTKEIKEQFSYNAVMHTNSELMEINAKLQVTPREINLFYIEKGIRQRIVQEGDRFIIDGVGVHTEETLLELLESHPERFSPNVILRPVYQEIILPNLCYVGGAGEITYWLQIKGVFDALELPYPMIQVRNSVLWMDKSVSGKMDKLGFEISDVFKDTDVWKKEFVQQNAGDELDFTSLDIALKSFEEEIVSTILNTDSSGEQYANAEVARLRKQIDAIKAKGIKKSKGKHEQAMKAIDQIKSRLFPNNGLQERYVNFFQFCADGEVQSHLNDLNSALDPFSNDLIVLVDE